MQSALSREEISKVFGRHYGVKMRLASELAVTPSAITLWLNGSSNSIRIAEAAERAAREILAEEGKAEDEMERMRR